MPDLFIIAGPNGAGKTTAAKTLLPDILACMEYVNADSIAAALSPFKPETVAVEAGRLMLKRIKELIAQKENLAFETTLASRSFAKLINDCKSDGYTVTLIYFWLPDYHAAISRVKSRVAMGGHFIPNETVKRRYKRSINNLRNLYMPLVDFAYIYDSSKNKLADIAFFESGSGLDIQNAKVWESIQ